MSNPIDHVWFLDQERHFALRVLDYLDRPTLKDGSLAPEGCGAGDRGQGTLFSFHLLSGLLDLVERHQDLKDRIYAAVRRSTKHFYAEHVYGLPDASCGAPGETVTRHPVRVGADCPDSDLLRHQDFEWLTRFRDFGLDLPMEATSRLALRLFRMADPIRMREVDFQCEGAHGRLRLAGNLVYFYRLVGHEKLLEMAEALVYCSLHGTDRKTPDGVKCWAGSDEFEQGWQDSTGKWVWKGNPRGDHRTASAWHVGDLVRFLVAVWETTRKPVIKQLCQDWVTTWAEVAFYETNPILSSTGLELDEDHLVHNLPWPQGGYERIVGCENWVWDNSYGQAIIATSSPNLITRRYYPSHASGEPKRWKEQIPYGWADLFWFAHLLTGQERYRLAAYALFRDLRAWFTVYGVDKEVGKHNANARPYGPGSVLYGAGRDVGWWATCGKYLPWWKT